MTRHFRVDINANWIAEAPDHWTEAQVEDWVFDRVRSQILDNLREVFSTREILGKNYVDFVVDEDGMEE